VTSDRFLRFSDLLTLGGLAISTEHIQHWSEQTCLVRLADPSNSSLTVVGRTRNETLGYFLYSHNGE
jgi:hypothetical protein